MNDVLQDKFAHCNGPCDPTPRDYAIERLMRSNFDRPLLKSLETIFAVHQLGGLTDDEAVYCANLLLGAVG